MFTFHNHVSRIIFLYFCSAEGQVNFLIDLTLQKGFLFSITPHFCRLIQICLSITCRFWCSECSTVVTKLYKKGSILLTKLKWNVTWEAYLLLSSLWQGLKEAHYIFQMTFLVGNQADSIAWHQPNIEIYRNSNFSNWLTITNKY